MKRCYKIALGILLMASLVGCSRVAETEEAVTVETVEESTKQESAVLEEAEVEETQDIFPEEETEEMIEEERPTEVAEVDYGRACDRGYFRTEWLPGSHRCRTSAERQFRERACRSWRIRNEGKSSRWYDRGIYRNP